MVDFTYREMFSLQDDPTEYRLLTADHISAVEVDGTRLLRVASEGLTLLAEQAFSDVSHFLRASHLKQMAAIFDDAESAANDKTVALELLKNAVIAAEGEFPMCQDTGTAIVIGKKGQSVWTGYSDEEALSKGIFNAYTQGNLRYSQNTALTTYEEKNTGCNLPAQFELYAVPGNEYHFLFLAKGGGSANKTYLYQETKAVLTPQRLLDFMKDKMKSLGTAACPPICYRRDFCRTQSENR
jgi:fumarate hydratase class I